MLSPLADTPQFASCNFNNWLIDGVPAQEMEAKYMLAGGSSETLYDETTYLNALRKRGSPLPKNLDLG
jgi:hypothetical protein